MAIFNSFLYVYQRVQGTSFLERSTSITMIAPGQLSLQPIYGGDETNHVNPSYSSVITHGNWNIHYV